MTQPEDFLAPYAGHLRVRVCGICLLDDKVLVVQHKATVGNQAFWAPPGGGLRYGEKIKDCLVREVREETGLIVEAGNFICVNEFIGAPLHAIELFFAVQLLHGELQTGYDPEAGPHLQLIQNVHFLTLAELRQTDQPDLHPIFHGLSSLEEILHSGSRFLR
jgi:8-oxo-dGTP diphosphatase